MPSSRVGLPSCLLSQIGMVYECGEIREGRWVWQVEPHGLDGGLFLRQSPIPAPRTNMAWTHVLMQLCENASGALLHGTSVQSNTRLVSCDEAGGAYYCTSTIARWSTLLPNLEGRSRSEHGRSASTQTAGRPKRSKAIGSNSRIEHLATGSHLHPERRFGGAHLASSGRISFGGQKMRAAPPPKWEGFNGGKSAPQRFELNFSMKDPEAEPHGVGATLEPPPYYILNFFPSSRPRRKARSGEVEEQSLKNHPNNDHPACFTSGRNFYPIRELYYPPQKLVGLLVLK
jgi:hypothetical protein